MNVVPALSATLVAGVLVLGPTLSGAQGTSTVPRAAQDHSGHGSGQQQPPVSTPEDHAAHGQAAGQKPQPPASPPEGHSVQGQAHDQKGHTSGLPPLTDEDRQAAFPDLKEQHTVHDDAVQTFVLFDQLEWQAGHGATGLSWDNKGWIGGDVNRFWFRTEGESEDGRLGSAQAHAFYGRAIARWWELVVGIRQDFRPGPGQTWTAVGIQGLAPYWFEVEATAYVGASGRTHFRVKTEYDLLLTNRVILQPLLEVEIYGMSDPERGIGAGLSSADAGLRLRYELRRELAPYVGVTWHRTFLGTADLAEAEGEKTGGARVALGVRVWF